MDEIELKFFDIDTEDIQKKILALGAVKKFEGDAASMNFNNKELGFDFTSSDKKYLRLRDSEGKTLLTFKSADRGGKMKNREEIQVEVSDFEKAQLILERIGFEPTKKDTKKRIHYVLGKIAFEIDDLGWLPPYLEIETQSEQDMEDVCKKLGLDINKGEKRTIPEIYPERFK